MSTTHETESSKCPHCNGAISSGARFCRHCGEAQRPSDDEQRAATATPVPGAPSPEADMHTTTAVSPLDASGRGPAPAAPPTPVATTPVGAQPQSSDEAQPTAERTQHGSQPSFCGACGARYVSGTRFCGGCGTPRTQADGATPTETQQPPRVAAAQSLNGALEQLNGWRRSLPAPFNTVPPELLAVCALMAAAGALTLYPTVRVLPDILQALGESGLARTFGLLLLSVWAMLAFFGGASLYLAWRLGHGDRVARGLAYVLLGGLGAAILIGGQRPTEFVFVMVFCFAALAVLGGAQRVRAFFAEAGEPEREQPTPVVIARTLVAVWSGAMILVGVTWLPLGGLAQPFVPIGLALIAIGGGAWYLNRRLAIGDPTARAIISAGAAIYLVLLLILGERQPGVIIPLSLAVGVVIHLWLPQQSQEYFAGKRAS